MPFNGQILMQLQNCILISQIYVYIYQTVVVRNINIKPSIGLHVISKNRSLLNVFEKPDLWLYILTAVGIDIYCHCQKISNYIFHARKLNRIVKQIPCHWIATDQFNRCKMAGDYNQAQIINGRFYLHELLFQTL